MTETTLRVGLSELLSRVLSASRRRSASRVPVLASYDHSTFWHRHRRGCYVAFGAFSFLYGAAFALFGQFILSQFLSPLAVLAGIVVWLLPTTERVATKALWVGLCAFVVALLCWPDYLAIVIPGMPWITAVRLVGFPLAFLFFISLSQSKVFQAYLKDVCSESRWVWTLIIAFVVVTTVAVFTSTDIGSSIGRFVRLQLTWTVMFFVAVFAFSVKDREWPFIALLWGIIIYLSAIALWEHRLGRLPWLGHIPTIFRIDPELAEQITKPKTRAFTGLFRVQAVQTTPLGLAEVFALATPFVFYVVFHAARLVTRVFAAITLAVIFYVIILTDSRLGSVGFLISALLYVLALAVQRWRKDRSSLLAPAIIVVYPALFAAFIAGTFFVRRLRYLVWGDGSSQSSTDARTLQWEAGLPKVLARPWGHGVGQGAETLGWSSSASGPGSIDTYYLSILLEYGFVGFVVFYGIFIMATYYACREVYRGEGAYTSLLTPAAITLINFIIIKSVFSQEANHPLIFILLGMTVALVYKNRRGVSA